MNNKEKEVEEIKHITNIEVNIKVEVKEDYLKERVEEDNKVRDERKVKVRKKKIFFSL